MTSRGGLHAEPPGTANPEFIGAPLLGNAEGRLGQVLNLGSLTVPALVELHGDQLRWRPAHEGRFERVTRVVPKLLWQFVKLAQGSDDMILKFA